eukprot:m51a1_g11641 hypothetical protein (280) ;mRNA; f:3139-4287
MSFDYVAYACRRVLRERNKVDANIKPRPARPPCCSSSDAASASLLETQGFDSNELFCSETAEVVGNNVFIGLRWYARPEAVIGLAPDELARTLCWFMVSAETFDRLLASMDAATAEEAAAAASKYSVDYYYEVMASQVELYREAVNVDPAWWAPEVFLGNQERCTNAVCSVGPNAVPCLRDIGDILRARVPLFAVRPFGIPIPYPLPIPIPIPIPLPALPAEEPLPHAQGVAVGGRARSATETETETETKTKTKTKTGTTAVASRTTTRPLKRRRTRLE